jgi:hypothetical protein
MACFLLSLAQAEAAEKEFAKELVISSKKMPKKPQAATMTLEEEAMCVRVMLEWCSAGLPKAVDALNGSKQGGALFHTIIGYNSLDSWSPLSETEGRWGHRSATLQTHE